MTTQDKAWARVLEARSRLFIAHSPQQIMYAELGHDEAVRAYAAAAVEAALADTLGLLEALANCDDGWMELKWNTPKGWVGIRIMTEPAKLQVRYYYNGWQNATRAEAEALLAGEETKE